MKRAIIFPEPEAPNHTKIITNHNRDQLGDEKNPHSNFVATCHKFGK